MEAWIFAYWGSIARPNIDVQSEDACVLVAKRITAYYSGVGICINTFDGRVLYFVRGSQVARP